MGWVGEIGSREVKSHSKHAGGTNCLNYKKNMDKEGAKATQALSLYFPTKRLISLSSRTCKSSSRTYL